jgi:ADP-ribosyl-[dinitrogen reductase] hydrolase
VATTDKHDRDLARACLLGGAVGDALGAPIEFLKLSEIRAQFGPEGISDFVAGQWPAGSITDDTQKTLFTAEGLIRGEVRWSQRGVSHRPAGPDVAAAALRRR